MPPPVASDIKWRPGLNGASPPDDVSPIIGAPNFGAELTQHQQNQLHLDGPTNADGGVDFVRYGGFYLELDHGFSGMVLNPFFFLGNGGLPAPGGAPLRIANFTAANIGKTFRFHYRDDAANTRIDSILITGIGDHFSSQNALGRWFYELDPPGGSLNGNQFTDDLSIFCGASHIGQIWAPGPYTRNRDTLISEGAVTGGSIYSLAIANAYADDFSAPDSLTPPTGTFGLTPYTDAVLFGAVDTTIPHPSGDWFDSDYTCVVIQKHYLEGMCPPTFQVYHWVVATGDGVP